MKRKELISRETMLRLPYFFAGLLAAAWVITLIITVFEIRPFDDADFWLSALALGSGALCFHNSERLKHWWWGKKSQLKKNDRIMIFSVAIWFIMWPLLGYIIDPYDFIYDDEMKLFWLVWAAPLVLVPLFRFLYAKIVE